MMQLGVFCSSAKELDADHMDAAHELARQCALNGVGIVHGGSDTGLMKHLTVAVNAFGGFVEGVMCASLAAGRYQADDFSKTVVEPSYLKRVASVLDESDAVVVLPGGIGTLHEALTAIVLKHVGEWDGQIVISNPRGYWGCLIGLLGLYHGSKPRLYASDTGRISPEEVRILSGCDPIIHGCDLFVAATGIPAAPLPWERDATGGSTEAGERDSPSVARGSSPIGGATGDDRPS